jgi:hypothetical protein
VTPGLFRNVESLAIERQIATTRDQTALLGVLACHMQVGLIARR